MAPTDESLNEHQQPDTSEKASEPNQISKSRWKRMFGRSNTARGPTISEASSEGFEEMKSRPEKWSMGVLNDRETEEVPGESIC